MRCLCCVIFALVALLAQAAEPALKIEEYRFEWTVAEAGKAKLFVEKTNETTRIRIYDEHNFLSMSPADAKLVGIALAQADKYYAKFKGSKEDVQDSLAAGEHEVTFRTSVKYGFGIYIREKERLAFGSTTSLDRKQAAAFAPYLKRADEMADQVDKVIGGALEQ
jgi:hypothetical protein